VGDHSDVTKKNELATTHNERKQATEEGRPVTRASKTHATGRIDVQTYVPQPYEEVDEGPNLVEINVSETFSGDIEGEGVVRFLQAVRNDGSACFVGIERVTGSVGSRTGSFLLQDAGTLEGSTVKGEWFVVPGSGTGELRGLRGDGGFTAELGQRASITLDYWFE
jgi:Protein of unknown function (DUF3224)